VVSLPRADLHERARGLGRQFERRGVTDFRRNDNCFQRLGDPRRAQRLMDDPLTANGPHALDAVARALHPLHRAIFKPWPMDYYGSAYQTEWATDVLFKDPKSLAEIYPALVKHAITHFKSPDVLRFLGKKAHGNFLGELQTSFKDRAEGVRIKHGVAGNSIQMYDKAGSVLRVETTLAKPTPFKVLRPLQDRPDGKFDGRPMRKGVADLPRRAQVSQRANETYLEALTAVTDPTPLSEILDPVARPTNYRGRRRRALRVGDPTDLALLEAVSRGEFATAGFQNKDLRRHLSPVRVDATPEERRRVCSRISRLLALLRAHRLITKIPKSHRYRLTQRGQLLTAALFAARAASVDELIAKAA
jgi:hypothetical protein